MIGFGTTGTVSSTYFTWNASPNGSGVKRWGTQKIDEDFILSYDGGGDVGSSTNIGFSMEFLLSDSDYEAGFGWFDSGGGTFVEENGEWKLAGINTVVYAADANTPEGSYDRLFSVSIPAYHTWITNTIDSVTGDDDSDGIPNWWEDQFGTNIMATADQDSDGLTGEQEYIADTDPTDSNQVFRIDALVVVDDQQIEFDGSTARQYQLSTSTNQFESWGSVGSPAWGTGTNSSITVNNTEKNVFYRLHVTLP